MAEIDLVAGPGVGLGHMQASAGRLRRSFCFNILNPRLAAIRDGPLLRNEGGTLRPPLGCAASSRIFGAMHVLWQEACLALATASSAARAMVSAYGRNAHRPK